MTELENDQIEGLRKGLRALLDMDLAPDVAEVVRRLLGLIGDPTRTMDDVVKALEQMFQPLSPEAAALRLTAQLRENAGRQKPILGRPYGHGTRPPEKGQDDPRLRAVADQLKKKIRDGRRRPGGRT